MLLKSSIICTLIHYVALLDIPSIYLFGLATSIINHGFNNDYAIKLDRYFMRFCFLYNLLYIYRFQLIIEFLLLISATLLYFISFQRDKKKSLIHAFAHILISICNIQITRINSNDIH